MTLRSAITAARTRNGVKACNCCGTIFPRLKRVCDSCKVPAIWREITAEEFATLKARHDRTEALLDELMGEIRAEREASNGAD